VNLTEWVHAQDIHVTTAYRWYREGTLPVPVWNRALKPVGCARRDIGMQAVPEAGSGSCGGVG
jgi:hypothetical protein